MFQSFLYQTFYFYGSQDDGISRNKCAKKIWFHLVLIQLHVLEHVSLPLGWVGCALQYELIRSKHAVCIFLCVCSAYILANYSLVEAKIAVYSPARSTSGQSKPDLSSYLRLTKNTILSLYTVGVSPSVSDIWATIQVPPSDETTTLLPSVPLMVQWFLFLFFKYKVLSAVSPVLWVKTRRKGVFHWKSLLFSIFI